MPIRACRDCGEEYRLEAQVSVCSDCGGPIEWRDDDAPATAGTPAKLPEGPYALFAIRDSASELTPLVERLRAANIPFGARGSTNRYEVWVPESQVAAARDALREDATDTDAAAEADPATGPLRCPACDTELPPDAHECPECGLGIGGVSEE